jgi:hypothetical protein
MKYRLFLFLLTTVAFSACSPGEQTYDKNGISFSYPGGWEIWEETEELEGFILRLNEQNFSGTSFRQLFVTWQKPMEGLVPTEWLEYTLGLMRDDPKMLSFDFTPPAADTYNGFSGFSSQFTMKIKTGEAQGTIYAFGNEHWTVHLMEQYSPDDPAKAERAFELIRSTFTLK